MSKACAFCGERRTPTREHIWPSGFLARQRPELSYSRRADATFRGDLIIRDVCETCNNGVLSSLDSHACTLFDRYFSKPVKAREEVEFEYDFSCLSRWLLKVSYNASRGTGEDEPFLRPYAATIIAPYPTSPAFCGFFVETVKPAGFTQPKTGTYRTIRPEGYRCAQMRFVNEEPDARSLCFRMVVINAFIFAIVITRASTLSMQDSLVIRENLRGIPLHPSGSVKIPPPTKTTMNAFSGVERWPKPKL